MDPYGHRQYASIFKWVQPLTNRCHLHEVHIRSDHCFLCPRRRPGKRNKFKLDEKHTGKKTCPWWYHQMETFSALLVLCEGNPPVTMDYHHKGQWRGALMFSLICAWTNGWANNWDAGDLRHHCALYDVTVISTDTQRRMILFSIEETWEKCLLAPIAG